MMDLPPVLLLILASMTLLLPTPPPSPPGESVDRDQVDIPPALPSAIDATNTATVSLPKSIGTSTITIDALVDEQGHLHDSISHVRVGRGSDVNNTCYMARKPPK